MRSLKRKNNTQNAFEQSWNVHAIVEETTELHMFEDHYIVEDESHRTTYRWESRECASLLHITESNRWHV